MNILFKKNLVFSVLLCVFATKQPCIAQSAGILHAQPDHFLFNKGVIFSSSYEETNLAGHINYQNQIGLLTEIRNFYTDFITQLHPDRYIGLKLYSEQETSLFTKSKIHGFYKNVVRISGKLHWSVAGEVGLVNIRFGSSTASAGGSDWDFNINLSSTLSYKKTTEIGIAVLQIPNRILTPIGFSFQLQRYGNAYLSHLFKINPNLTYEGAFRGLVTSTEQRLYLENKLTIDKKYGLLLSVSDRVSAGGFINVLTSGQKKALTFSMSYNTGRLNSTFKQERFSFGLLFKTD